MFSPVHFLSCRLPFKLLTVWVRDYRLNLPALSVTLRGAPGEETLDAAELEVECREWRYVYGAPVWAVKKKQPTTFFTLKTLTNQTSESLEVIFLLR